jgi:hypothetical protein
MCLFNASVLNNNLLQNLHSVLHLGSSGVISSSNSRTRVSFRCLQTSSCFFLYQDDENTVIQNSHFNLFSKAEFLGGKAEFLVGKAEFLGGKAEFLGGKAEFLVGKAEFLGGKAEFLAVSGSF